VIPDSTVRAGMHGPAGLLGHLFAWKKKQKKTGRRYLVYLVKIFCFNIIVLSFTFDNYCLIIN